MFQCNRILQSTALYRIWYDQSTYFVNFVLLLSCHDHFQTLIVLRECNISYCQQQPAVPGEEADDEWDTIPNRFFCRDLSTIQRTETY